MFKKKCKICNKIFYVIPYRKNKAKYCSLECCWVFKRMFPPKTAYKKGQFAGSKHPQWKNGTQRTYSGYILVYTPKHPFCDRHGYVRRSRRVMEKYLKRYLKPEEQVHHLNGIKDDDRIENLKLFPSNSDHLKFHFPKGSLFGINANHK